MDGQTEACLRCGALMTGGRFCTRCGARLGSEPTNPRSWPASTDTAERVYGPPEPAYAAPTAATTSPAPSPAYGASQPAHAAPAPGGRRPGPGPGLWIGVAVAMVVVVLLGGYLLLRGSGGGADQGSSAQPILPTSNAPSPSGSGSASASASPSSPSPTVAGPPADVAGLSHASAPRHAPAGVDFAGRPVSYVAANLVDGRNDTCWRTPGDATGTVLTFRLDQPTRLTRVGLVNGYAKIAYSAGRSYDWYRGNRRVLAVDWIFGDGSSVSQRFGSSRTMQQEAIKPVTTSVVKVRITAVSKPGKGRAARNDTAISEVLLLGRTA